ncbi:MAG: hypothetical protein GY854_21245 [Deltaproteobacteria bacterium]|nr:hypothetical protein [Deltaproteobacteria bacterium]
MRFAMVILCTAVAIACNVGSKEKLAPVLDPDDSSREVSQAAKKDELVTCPVCGLSFSAKEGIGTHAYNGTVYHFLIKDHMRAFIDQPLEYLQKEGQDQSR